MTRGKQLEKRLFLLFSVLNKRKRLKFLFNLVAFHLTWLYILCMCDCFQHRFDFLQSWNQYNTYYEFKKNYFMQKEGISLPEVCVSFFFSSP